MSLNTFDSAQRQEERRRARQRQLQIMERASGGAVVSEPTPSTSKPSMSQPKATIADLGDGNSSRSSSRSSSSNGSGGGASSNKPSSGFHAPPANAVESARRFLWDDDDDEYKVPSRMFGGGGGAPGSHMQNIGSGGSATGSSATGGGGGPSSADPNRQVSLYDVDLYASKADPRKERKEGDGSYLSDIVEFCWCSPSSRRTVAVVSAAVCLLCAAFLVIGKYAFGMPALGPLSPTIDDADALAGESDRYRDFASFIVRSGISDQMDLLKKNEPQNKALRWVADYDAASVSLKSDVVALERYALAVLFFSMDLASPNGGSSVSEWMSPTPTCSWEGIDCIVRSGEDTSRKLRNGIERNAAEILDENGGEDIVDTQWNGVVKVLNLTKSRVGGKIPREIAAFSSLKALDLSLNSIGGSIPEEIGRLGDLEDLRLLSNQLVGQIPTTVGSLKKLKHLSLHTNQLTGPIPEELGKLRNLEFLNLRSNKLAGTIHPNLGNLKDLKEVYLYHNDLLDAMPESVCKLRDESLSVLSADCSGKFPKVNCTCCTHCFS